MRKYLWIALGLCWYLLAPNPAFAYENRALIMYDTAYEDASVPYWARDKILSSLLGHFNLPYRRKPVHRYQKGDINKYKITFYIGNTSGRKLSKGFLRDVLYADRPVVWINFNLAQLAQAKAYRSTFEKRYGFRYLGPIHENPYEKVSFRGQTFFREQERIGKTKILNKKRAKVMGLARTPDGSEFFPYIVRAGTFAYVADNPLDVQVDNSVYVVFAEALHTFLNIPHRKNQRALVRLEDVTPKSDPAKIRAATDYLYGSGVPFGISVIPKYVDPRGVYGSPEAVDLNQAPALVSALKYARARGGTLLMHGLTHQYRDVTNPFTGTSTDDYEFYIARLVNGATREITPVPEDSRGWVEWRINEGFNIFNRAGLPRPSIWVTPHYGASDLDYRVFSEKFAAMNERPHLGVFFPYVIYKSAYGGKIIPENLGFINPQIRPASTITMLAKKNLVVRDGFAGFYFHPEKTAINELDKAIRSVRALGYKFVSIKSL